MIKLAKSLRTALGKQFVLCVCYLLFLPGGDKGPPLHGLTVYAFLLLVTMTIVKYRTCQIIVTMNTSNVKGMAMQEMMIPRRPETLQFLEIKVSMSRSCFKGMISLEISESRISNGHTLNEYLQ